MTTQNPPVLELLRAALLAEAIDDQESREVLLEAFNERSGLAGTPNEVVDIIKEEDEPRMLTPKSPASDWTSTGAQGLAYANLRLQLSGDDEIVRHLGLHEA